MKKPFYRIDFKNCEDRNFVICHWSEVNVYIDLVRQESEDLDETGYNIYQQNGWLPEATVTVVMMTDEEYSVWFTKNIEANA